MGFLENWKITEEEYREIEKWFKEKHEVQL
jgi:hypothetical protein